MATTWTDVRCLKYDHPKRTSDSSRARNGCPRRDTKVKRGWMQGQIPLNVEDVVNAELAILKTTRDTKQSSHLLVDEQLGRVWDALERLGMWDDTVIVVTSVSRSSSKRDMAASFGGRARGRGR